ncbi:MAG: SseB family protein [Geothermobacteraceae bacterium]
MTELDQALELFHQDVTNPENQSHFYDLFLNTAIYIPVHPEEGVDPGRDRSGEEGTVPLVLEAEGDDYLMLFDSREKMNAWAEGEPDYIMLPGYVIAEYSVEGLHWALNVGTEQQKQFVPDEIGWLKQVVEAYNAEHGGEAAAD